MQKFAIDFTALEQNLTKPEFYKYADVQDKIRKVAYDVVQFVDDDIDGLWQIKNTPDGEVILAKYDDSQKTTGENTADLEVKSEWKVMSDRTKTAVHIFYKNEPITKMALNQVGISTEDAHLVCEVLREKLAKDTTARSSFVKGLPAKEKEYLYKKFPELKF